MSPQTFFRWVMEGFQTVPTDFKHESVGNTLFDEETF
jgi:hypothetical protein